MLVRIVRKVIFRVTRKNSGPFGAPNRIFSDTGTELFESHKTGTDPGKSGRMGPFA